MSKKNIALTVFVNLMCIFSMEASDFTIRTSKGVTKVSSDDQPLNKNAPESLLISRFIRKNDLKVNEVWGIPLRNTWWSRPHEYAWAMQFAGPDFVVLDAACGISHPFKWYLADHCKKTWACDIDPRLTSKAAVIKETYDDLGEEAFNVLVDKDYIFKKITLVNQSIFDLPESMPSFDRIFCISTLEHLKPEERVRVFENFARVLSPQGWIVLTVDYPVVTPEELSENARKANLVPVGIEEIGSPDSNALSNGLYTIYRCVYRHAK